MSDAVSNERLHASSFLQGQNASYVEQLYAAYRQSNLTLEEFEGPRYQRISHIKKLLAEGVLDALGIAAPSTVPCPLSPALGQTDIGW